MKLKKYGFIALATCAITLTIGSSPSAAQSIGSLSRRDVNYLRDLYGFLADGEDYAEAFNFAMQFSHQEHVELGNLMCDTFSEGMTIDDMARVVGEQMNVRSLSDSQQRSVGHFIGAASVSSITYYCPQHQNLLDVYR